MSDPELAYERHARTCDEDAFWEQVRRTVNGKPLGDDQIDMIVTEMRRLLEPRPDDVFLDLCCGNGALTDRIFADGQSGTGVDISETLIAVARKHFARDGVQYVVEDATAYSQRLALDEQVTCALIYGSFCYFPADRAQALLAALRTHPTLSRLVIGNVADRDRLHDFFAPDRYVPDIENDPGSAIGRWWSEVEFADLARVTGWSPSFSRMPETFYAAHYRFDITLEPV